LAKTVLGAMRSIRILESRTSRTSIIAFRREAIRLVGYCSACRTENIKSSRKSESGQYVKVVRCWKRSDRKPTYSLRYRWSQLAERPSLTSSPPCCYCFDRRGGSRIFYSFPQRWSIACLMVCRTSRCGVATSNR
jgi:hypothetical protein